MELIASVCVAFVYNVFHVDGASKWEVGCIRQVAGVNVGHLATQFKPCHLGQGVTRTELALDLLGGQHSLGTLLVLMDCEEGRPAMVSDKLS